MLCSRDSWEKPLPPCGLLPPVAPDQSVLSPTSPRLGIPLQRRPCRPDGLVPPLVAWVCSALQLWNDLRASWAKVCDLAGSGAVGTEQQHTLAETHASTWAATDDGMLKFSTSALCNATWLM